MLEGEKIIPMGETSQIDSSPTKMREELSGVPADGLREGRGCRDRGAGGRRRHLGRARGRKLRCWGEKNVRNPQWSGNSFASHGAALKGWLPTWDPINSNCISQRRLRCVLGLSVGFLARTPSCPGVRWHQALLARLFHFEITPSRS